MFMGNYKGADQFGNKYYQAKYRENFLGQKVRWVLYRDNIEASAIPGAWFNWLHYQTDSVPSTNELQYSWQKEHLPNLTGSTAAYFPNNALNNQSRQPSGSDYQAWRI